MPRRAPVHPRLLPGSPPNDRGLPSRAVDPATPASASAPRPPTGLVTRARGCAMPDPTTEFFEGLAERGHIPALHRTTRTLRVDVDRDGRTDHWVPRYPARHGRRLPGRADADADCVIAAPGSLMDDLVTGRANAMASTLRDEPVMSGDPNVLVRFQRLFPDPTGPAEDGLGADGRQAEGLTMASQMVRILDGNTFVVRDERGDIEASPTEPTGLFSFDTRYLSKWVMTVNGGRLNSLSIDDLNYFESRFFLVPGTGTVYIDAKLSVIRQRAVGHGFHEELTVLNHEPTPVDLVIRIDAASDFADLFEVKDALKKVGTYSVGGRGRPAATRLSARVVPEGDAHLRPSPPAFDENGLTFTIRSPGARRLDDRHRRHHDPRGAGGSAYTRPKYQRGRKHAPEHGAQPRQVDRRCPAPRLRPGAADRSTVVASSTSPRCGSRRRSPGGEPPGGRPAVVHDDVRPGQHPHQPPVAAVRARARGHDPARPRRLAGQPPRRLPRRGPRPDPPRDALRRDGRVRGAAPLAVLRLGRRDAAVGRPARRVRALDRRPQARPRPRVRGPGGAQLDRRVRRPDGQRLHLVQAAQRADRAREPGWKDSWNSISYSDGRLPDFPRATCELQGYAYDAKMRGAGWPGWCGRTRPTPSTLEAQAADLKRRFNRDFWIPEREYFALALDADGSQVDSLASNIGHLLWSGIVDASKAKAVVVAT